MTNNEQISTEWMNSENEMHDCVMNAQELTEGILFLLKEYYIGSFTMNENMVFIRFNNGQQFSISIKQED